MRPLLSLLLFSILFCFPVSARSRLSGWCENGNQTVTTVGIPTSTTKVQRSYPGCTITVYVAGTTNLATIYADNNGTPKANPFTASTSNGQWFFYINDGDWDVNFSGAGISAPFTRTFNAIDPYYYTSDGVHRRLISEKLRDQLSVKDYGATGDGVTDDTVAIQEAINAAQNIGAAVYFPATDAFYGITAPLILHTNSALMCASPGLAPDIEGGAPLVAIKALPGWVKVSGDALVLNDQSDYAWFSSITNCTLEGNATYGPDYGIYYNNGNFLNLTNVMVNISKLDGIFLNTDCRGCPGKLNQSGIFDNVYVFNAIKNTGLTEMHGALHIQWTDVILQNSTFTTNTENSYTEGGFRTACWLDYASGNNYAINTECSHSERGWEIDSALSRFANSRAQFNAGEGWNISGEGMAGGYGNTFISIASQFNARSATGNSGGGAATGFDDIHVTGGGNLFSGSTELCANGTGFANRNRYALFFSNGNNPPNQVWGNSRANGTETCSYTQPEVWTDTPGKLIYDNYRVEFEGTEPDNPASITVNKRSTVFLGPGMSTPYNITSLTDGVPGQMVTLISNFTGNTPTLVHGTNIKLVNDFDWSPIGIFSINSITLRTPDGVVWYEINRNDGTSGISESAAQILDLSETANNRFWKLVSNTGFQQMLGYACNDNLTVCNAWLTVNRSGATPTYAGLPVRVVLGDSWPSGGGDDGTTRVQFYGAQRSLGAAFADLGSLTISGAAAFVWCYNCTVNVTPPNTCSGSGSGAWAFRNSSNVWKCPF